MFYSFSFFTFCFFIGVHSYGSPQSKSSSTSSSQANPVWDVRDQTPQNKNEYPVMPSRPAPPNLILDPECTPLNLETLSKDSPFLWKPTKDNSPKGKTQQGQTILGFMKKRDTTDPRYYKKMI